MKWVYYKLFNNIPNHHLYELLKLRQDIFIVEQDCVYHDIDNYDQKSTHLLLLDGKKLAAYSRILPVGLKYEEASIGRIMVNPEYRGCGFGKKVVKKSVDILKGLGETKIRIEAQAHLQNFYFDLGFLDDSEIYNVDGIPHLQMVMKLK